MTPQELQSVSEDINRLIADTQDGRITWVKTNPTTFLWRKVVAGNPIAQLSVQKVLQRKTVLSAGAPPRATIQIIENYIFQAVEFPSGNLRLVINTEQDADARQVLKNLFDTISTTIDRAGLNFLKQVIGP
jgi:hypothetical protein